MKTKTAVIGLADATKEDIEALKKKYPSGYHKTKRSDGGDLPKNGVFVTSGRRG